MGVRWRVAASRWGGVEVQGRRHRGVEVRPRRGGRGERLAVQVERDGARASLAMGGEVSCKTVPYLNFACFSCCARC
jgi:hypothetical protein